MKKPTNITPATFSNSDRTSTKKLARSAKKTILTIAPNETDFEESTKCDTDETYDDEHANRLVSSDQSISFELATSLSCDLMAIALQLRSWSSPKEKIESIQESVIRFLDEFDKARGTVTEAAKVPAETTMDGALPRLQLLLIQLNRNEIVIRDRNDTAMDRCAKQVLTNAIHAVIGAISQSTFFEQAVESASQRAIYQFAYGLTHEINNPLANIAARAQQMIANAASDSDRRSLATIVDQSMRAHEMLAEMMRVVPPRSLRTRIENIVAIVSDAAAVQERQWTHSKILCIQRMASKPLYCSIDRAAMIESVCSILQNAWQVCRPNDRVEIVCDEVERNHPDYGPADGFAKLPGPRIRIAIRDTGPGMSSGVADRAWDLYFSGREHGRGLGISLAKVRQTIDAHGGLVWIQSKPNAGCTVEIRLPKSPEPPCPRKAFSI